MKTTVRLLIIATILVVGVPVAQGQVTSWGVRGGVWLDPTDGFFGVEALMPISGNRLFFNPNIEHVFADDSFTTVNADVHYDFDAGDRAFFWVGAGIAGIIDGDLDGAVNALAGYGVRRGSLTPYLQAKIVFSDGDTSPVIGGGLRF